VRPTPLLLAILIPLAGLTAQVRLQELPELARLRAERLRPKQIAALEPFWADLQLEYRGNQKFLDERIEKVAELGDSVVPLLLEKLRPAQSGVNARHLASNCRRVLQRLDPSSFVDALAEMARGEHGIARSEAIHLLGYARVPQAARVLTTLVDKTTSEDQRQVIRSLRLLRAPEAAPKVVTLLGSQDRRLREEVLSYLIASRAGQVADTVVQALTTETDNKLLSSYIDYFAAAVHEHEAATEALLPLLDGERLDWPDRRNLVSALATVAPEGHDATRRKLYEVIEAGDTSSLAVSAAVALRELGDKQGASKVKRALDDRIRRNKRQASLYETRASLLFAIGEYAEAADDYEKILEHSDGLALTRRAYVGLIRAESHRHKIQQLVRHMKASGMTAAEFEEIARDDEAVAEAMLHDRVQSFLKQLAKKQAPR